MTVCSLGSGETVHRPLNQVLRGLVLEVDPRGRQVRTFTKSWRRSWRSPWQCRQYPELASSIVVHLATIYNREAGVVRLRLLYVAIATVSQRC